MPTITAPVTLNATTQPGYATHPVVELSGANIPAPSGSTANNGLTVTASGTTIEGFAINRFLGSVANGTGAGVALTGSGGDLVIADYLGTDVTGTVAEANSYAGVFLLSPHNTVGGTTAAARNVISGNGDRGIYFDGTPASGNLIEGNYIGTTADGLHALGNHFYGVRIDTTPPQQHHRRPDLDRRHRGRERHQRQRDAPTPVRRVDHRQ